MIFFLNIALFLIFFLINIIFFNKLRGALKYSLFMISYLTICYFVLFKSEYLTLYLILNLLFAISLKFFTNLFIETSPTLYLSEILLNKLSKEEAKKEFLNKTFINRYLVNLENQKLIKLSNKKIHLKFSGMIFYKFFSILFRFMFR